jgi:hypothetical protein
MLKQMEFKVSFILNVEELCSPVGGFSRISSQQPTERKNDLRAVSTPASTTNESVYVTEWLGDKPE